MNLIKTFNGPKHLEYITLFSRINSYNCGLLGCKIYAKNGFFYSNNQIICFYCGLQLPITTSRIILKMNHSYLSPGCCFNIINSKYSYDYENVYEKESKFIIFKNDLIVYIFFLYYFR